MANSIQFPDFFSTKGPILQNVIPLNIGNNIYWMTSVISDNENGSSQTLPLQPYDDNEEGLVDCCDIDENYDIILTKSGKFMTSFYVPSCMLSFIIGPKGTKLKSLQRNTNTLIKVPKLNEKGDVKITGDTERKVASARTQISLIVTQRKDKLPISHFVSIPVTCDSVKERFKHFQEIILQQPPRGVTNSIFQKPEKLHLTICTLTLVDDQEMIMAKNVLQTCYDDFIASIFPKSNKHVIVIHGLEIMNDDPSEVNVLYGKVRMENKDSSDKLQEIADRISDYFYKAGLARKQYDSVKLHLTLMNTSFRNVDEKRENFNATDILEKFENYSFGTIEFSNIQLSVRFTSGENKFYESILTINI